MRSPRTTNGSRRSAPGASKPASSDRAARDEWYGLLARDLAGGEPGADALFDPAAIDDDVLSLMFISCHPVLSKEARIALTLRVVGGVGSNEIAKAFLVPVATIQARITRAKKTLAAAKVPFAVPAPGELAERLGSVPGCAGPDRARAGGLRAAGTVGAHRCKVPGPARCVREPGAARGPGPTAVGPVRGELLARLGRRDDARTELLAAVSLCGNAAERAALERKVDGLS